MTTPLMDALPSFQFSEQHSLDVDAPPERVWWALMNLRWSDLRITTPLFLVRSLGRSHRIAGRRLFEDGPITLMHTDAPRYIVGAQIGRPWQLRPELGPASSDLEQISEFDEPGWLKYGMDFTLDDVRPGRTRITTTTLCEPTDESARRWFQPYWAVIRPFSGLIRRDVLHAIARKALLPEIGRVAPGQRPLTGPVPRFGLPRYLRSEVAVPANPVLHVAGGVDGAISLGREHLDTLPEVTRELDLHCVMTWSSEGIRWTGWRFADLWAALLRDQAQPETTELVFTGLDGAAASIALDELLREDVLVAHSRDGQPLTRAQGAPYRLVAPQLYGYKQIKHVCRIELVDHHVRNRYEPWLMHPRGRVDLEERSGIGPSRLVRSLNGRFVRRALRSAGVRDPHLG